MEKNIQFEYAANLNENEQKYNAVEEKLRELES